MLISRILSGLAAMSLGAGMVLALTGFGPEAGAGTPPTVVKADRLDIRPTGRDCSQHAWPYFEAQCLRDRTQLHGQARQVRIVSTDRAM
jgi:hypothetical protein